MKMLKPLIGAVLLLTLLTACEHKPVAFQYQSTSVEGWELGDTLHFHIDSLKEAGNYQLSIGIRTSAATPYPYKSIWLVLGQHWHNPERFSRDTVECQLTNEEGEQNGYGVSLHQYDINWKQLQLPEKASADITVNHIMRLEIVQGIANVGIKLVRN